jgi:hypothetical protein
VPPAMLDRAIGREGDTAQCSVDPESLLKSIPEVLTSSEEDTEAQKAALRVVDYMMNKVSSVFLLHLTRLGIVDKVSRFARLAEREEELRSAAEAAAAAEAASNTAVERGMKLEAVRPPTRPHTHTHTHTHPRPFTSTHAHTHTSTPIHTHTFARTHVLKCARARTHASSRTHLKSTNSQREPVCHLTRVHLHPPCAQVDRKNPHLVCVATVADIDPSRDDSLHIHFDGWTEEYVAYVPLCLIAFFSVLLRLYEDAIRKQRLCFTLFFRALLCSTHVYSRVCSKHTLTQCTDRLKKSIGFAAEQTVFVHISLTIFQPVKTRTTPTRYDYWAAPRSTDLHPCGWCAAAGKPLQSPKG